jgi:superoxide dismutase, Cu-Zn family
VRTVRPAARRLAPVVVAAALLLTACGDDGPATAVGEGEEVGGEGVEDLPPGDDLERSTAGDGIGHEVTLIDVEGEDVGTVTFSESGTGVVIEARVRDLTPGFHGFHLHEEPSCEPDAADGPFTTAGGHWHGQGEDHGEHAGDLPPLLATSQGTAYLVVETDAFQLEELEGGPQGGVAVIVHADRDNLGHIPDRYTAEGEASSGADQETLATGDAGDRVACGVVGRAGASAGAADEDADDATEDAVTQEDGRDDEGADGTDDGGTDDGAEDGDTADDAGNGEDETAGGDDA